jgi:hypothetical protein
MLRGLGVGSGWLWMLATLGACGGDDTSTGAGRDRGLDGWQHEHRDGHDHRRARRGDQRPDDQRRLGDRCRDGRRDGHEHRHEHRRRDLELDDRLRDHRRGPVLRGCRGRRRRGVRRGAEQQRQRQLHGAVRDGSVRRRAGRPGRVLRRRQSGRRRRVHQLLVVPSDRPHPTAHKQATRAESLGFSAPGYRATDRESPAMPPRFGEGWETGAGVEAWGLR